MQPNPPHRPRTTVLTIAEVMDVLRIGRTKAYEQARLYLDTNGEAGLPASRSATPFASSVTPSKTSSANP